MDNTSYHLGRAPCGELEGFCTWGQRGRIKEKDKNTFTQTVKGKCGEITDLALQCSDQTSRILITSLHASYDIDGTNGLLQVFLGDLSNPGWCGRTMGGHLTVTFSYPLEGKVGQEVRLQLAGKSGIQGCLSVTGIVDPGVKEIG